MSETLPLRFPLPRQTAASVAFPVDWIRELEHKTTVLARYAVGLHLTGRSYGADCTFIICCADRWMSRPYVGITSPDWSSRDLFINDGRSPEWTAKIDVLDACGNRTQFENDVYFRVCNIGTPAARNVQAQSLAPTSATDVQTSALRLAPKNPA